MKHTHKPIDVNITIPEGVNDPSDIGGVWIDANIIVSDRNGQYIPKIFAENFLDEWNEKALKPLPADELANLKECLLDPSNQFYWDNWSDFEGRSTTDFDPGNGMIYRLNQDGDLWEIATLWDNKHILKDRRTLLKVIRQIKDQTNFDLNDILDEIESMLD